jgi:hypothetical protein
VSEPCPGGRHRFGPPTRLQATGGPLHGDWQARPCLDCDTFELSPSSGGDGIGPLIVRRSELGCDPVRARSR